MTRQEKAERLLANLTTREPDIEYIQRTLRMPADLWRRTRIAAAMCDMSMTQFMIALPEMQCPNFWKDDDEDKSLPVPLEVLRENFAAKRRARRASEDPDEGED